MTVPYKYLSEAELAAYLISSGNNGLEQWISSRDLDGFRIISWVRIVQEPSRSPDKWCVYRKESLDVGNEKFIDIDEFEDIGDPDSPEGERRVFGSVHDAMAYAESIGAARDKYVRVGEVQYIYKDFYIRNGSPRKGAKEWFNPTARKDG